MDWTRLLLVVGVVDTVSQGHTVLAAIQQKLPTVGTFGTVVQFGVPTLVTGSLTSPSGAVVKNVHARCCDTGRHIRDVPCGYRQTSEHRCAWFGTLERENQAPTRGTQGVDIEEWKYMGLYPWKIETIGCY